MTRNSHRLINGKQRSRLRLLLMTVSAMVAVAAYALTLTPTSSEGLSPVARDHAPNAVRPPHTTTAGNLIAAGPSRSECLTPNTASGQSGLSFIQSFTENFDKETGTVVTCISQYLNGATNWTSWEHPWITASIAGYTTWVSQEPQERQLVLALNLIPENLQNINNPTAWEKSCANGKYNSHATVLGTSLVAAGLQNSVIRLGAEMNGVWESDFIGTTTTEQKLWARCFANEVTGLRKATGEHFLIDWNVNACVGNYPFKNFYPGNAYVDIVGLDLYDVGCLTPKVSLTFSQLASEPEGLDGFEAFATAHNKPMSFPEWGLSTIPSGDDPAYINGMGSTFQKDDFAFESYFEGGGANVKALALGPSTPLSLAAFRNWFAPSK